jgi:hypothetical protein
MMPDGVSNVAPEVHFVAAAPESDLPGGRAPFTPSQRQISC